jgi:predicted CXXCH cytochrome family protein
VSAPRVVPALAIALALCAALAHAAPESTPAAQPPAGAPAAATAASAPGAPNTCMDCHRRQTEERLVAPTRNFAEDIHAVRGLGCVACHGGNPADPELSAMDPDKGFRGAPARIEIAEVCAKCHADAAYMKRYNPKPYVFSMAEFRTSVHCKKISEGDTKVATCTNCHGVHGILTRKDPRSPVYHRNVPITCSKCHNAEYMKGRSVPTNQFALYSQSVHGKALLERDDTAAPACNDCHGNHGAVPPNTRDISVVCGNCHGREGELFAKSKVSAAFLATGKRGCVTCHSNHGVQRPTDAMLSNGPGGVCASCHAPGSAGERGAALIIDRFGRLKGSLARADSLLNLAERRGMETSAARAQLREAQDRLVGARAAIHGFDAEAVQAVIAEGDGFASHAEADAGLALKDWRTRRIGMGLSLLVILATIGMLVLKIRQLDGKREA